MIYDTTKDGGLQLKASTYEVPAPAQDSHIYAEASIRGFNDSFLSSGAYDTAAQPYEVCGM